MSYSQPSTGLVCGWDNCGRKFSVLKNLVTHLSDDHVGFKKEKYSCRWTDCPRSHSTQSSRFALISHLRSHTGEKPYICPAPSCSREFTRSDSLNKHIRTTHPENAFPKAESLYGSSQPDSDQGYGDSLQESYEKPSSSRSRQPSRRVAAYQNLYDQGSPVSSQRYLSPAVHKLTKNQQHSRQVFETARESNASFSNPSEINLNSQQKYSLLKAKLLFVQDEREAFFEQIKEKKEKMRLLEAEKHLLLSSLIRIKVKLSKQATKRQEKREKRKLSKRIASESKKSKKKGAFAPKRRRVPV